MNSNLAPLEFSECLLDSPDYHRNLNLHEKELEKTSQQIKRIIKEIKDLLQAAKSESYNYVHSILIHTQSPSCDGIFIVVVHQSETNKQQTRANK